MSWSSSFAAAVIVTSGAVACTKVELETLPDPPEPPIDNQMSVAGSFCTQDPLAVEFPVKILFVVDTSGSMSITDPPDPAADNYTERTRAVIEVINALAGVTGVEIGIIAFHSSINDLTVGFQPDLSAENVANLTTAAASLGSNSAQTNYGGALDAAYQVLVADMLGADLLTRSRSEYVVIFLSDGLPNPSIPNSRVVGYVNNIKELEREQQLVGLEVHTVYLSGSTPSRFQQAPINLLRDMAEAGSGTFRNFANGERINFLDIGFTSFRRVFRMKSFLVNNLNAQPVVDIHDATDSDADGLTDTFEQVIGTDRAAADTDGDGFSDRLEHRLSSGGFDPIDGFDADCRVSDNDDYNRRDDDGDSLLNCEERFLGTSPRLYDTDADGLPDHFEVIARMTPVDDDFFGDLDRDGVVNGFEIRGRTNPRVDDREGFHTMKYRYDLRLVDIRESRSCFEFVVSNIRLVPSIPPTGGGLEGGWNTIHIVFGQSPADDPTDFGDFMLACARARYVLDTNEKLPRNGRLELPADAFHRPEEHDPEQHCVGP